jgi:eukaryotic-like serine/threonine-protein kinase
VDPPPRERWRQVEELLDAALDLAPEDRAAFLAESAAGDTDVRAEAGRLLAADGLVDRFLVRPAAEFAAPLLAAAAVELDSEPFPTRIGPYRVLREAGRGGMGTVFLGERDDPDLPQRVALKLVRPGLAIGTLAQRFIEERRILASLDHPNIARLLDGGITDGGVPWFAMEYVEGTPIDRYCADRRLSVRERLHLFLRVCEAVQHAHRSLVVHLDLKPANILVTDEGRVKLLDFGIARLLGAGARMEPKESAQAGLRPMTPAYASPEQIRGDPVSTATDVYALGILLYTLLAGRHPYLKPGRYACDAGRAILEEVAGPPSAAGEGPRRPLRGDLDAIVCMAMRKEPERRYGTAEQLAADILRHLAGRPVRARPGTWRYRSGKFVRRHAAGVTASFGFAALLVGYAVTATVHAERVAQEAARTEQVKDFLLSLFTHANPGVTQGREPTASELVDRGAARVSTELADQPALQAEMMTTLGQVYVTLGRYEPAVELLKGALAIRRGLPQVPHEAVARTGTLLSEALHYQGRTGEAEVLAREVLTVRRKLHGEDHWRVGIVLTDLGDLLHTRGNLVEAEEQLRLALRILLASRGADSPDVARARRDLGNVLRDRGAYEEAEQLYRQALRDLEDRFGRMDPMGALTRNELARLLAETGFYDESDRLLQRNLAVYGALYPEGHPMLGTTMRNLGVLHLRQGRPEEAADALREALVVYGETLGPDHPLVPRARRHLAQAVLESGDAPGAAALAEEVVRHFGRLGLAEHHAASHALHILESARATTGYAGVLR